MNNPNQAISFDQHHQSYIFYPRVAIHNHVTHSSFIKFGLCVVSAERHAAEPSSLSLCLSLPLISALCNVSHVISHLFHCGQTLLSHLTSPISPQPPLITAPPRFIQGTRYLDLPQSPFQRPLVCPMLLWCCVGSFPID